MFQSNDSTNGYLLERSNSARKTLERAVELMPEPERDDDDVSEDPESQEEMIEISQHEDAAHIADLPPDVTQTSCENSNNMPNNA